MSQDTKGRTMIGTGPNIPRPRPVATGSTPAPSVPSVPPGQVTSPPAPAPAASGPVPLPPSAQTYVAPPAAAPHSAQAPTRAGHVPVDATGEYDQLVGRELAGYVIRRKLAEGGMGVVFEGEHRAIGRRAAIKLLKLELCRDEGIVERFYQEARAVNEIRHENIVDIYDFGRDPNGRVFFVMEFLEGEPLSGRIHRGALTWYEAYAILDQTLRALKAAHEKGFVHRDLKPDNIWLQYIENRIVVKLLDFGIAKLVGTESPREKLTRTGTVMGTPHYMSPEQINGARDVDHRTDIYAMGVIMYEMFTGVTPFVGETLQAIMTGHLFREPPRLEQVPDMLGVPGPVAEIIDRMLVKDATGRYDSVADVLADLRDVHQQRPPTRAETLNRVRPARGHTVFPAPGTPPAPGASAAAVPATPSKRGRTRALVIGGAFAAIAGAAGAAVWSGRQREAAPVVAPAPPPGPDRPAPPPPPAIKIDPTAAAAAARAELREAAERGATPAVRKDGMNALGETKDQQALPIMTKGAELDPDGGVRGTAADAISRIGDPAPLAALARLERAAPPKLRPWFTGALLRLGDRDARRRLVAQASDPDLEIASKAALDLGELSKPGDPQAIAALRGLLKREADLVRATEDPTIGARVLQQLAALHDRPARELLYKHLEAEHEVTRIAAAQALARLGDDRGKAVAQAVLASREPGNQVAAAAVLALLADYSGLAVLTANVSNKNEKISSVAARALGEIGERDGLVPLTRLDPKTTPIAVRLAAARAIVTIVGIDPIVLADASEKMIKRAFESKDSAVRAAAAGVLADIPEANAIPLLGAALGDPEPAVRLAAAQTAAKMKTPAAAQTIAEKVGTEKDKATQEAQIVALGEIGSDVAQPALKDLAKKDGRVGVLAAGSLIASGDVSPQTQQKLEAAAAPRNPEPVRLAAMQAASFPKAVGRVFPTLVTGLSDAVATIRLTAAEGLARAELEKDKASRALNDLLANGDAGVVNRALAALARLGDSLAGKGPSPAEMVDSRDPKVRLAAVQIVRALPPPESVPLLRRLVNDLDRDVKRRAVDAIADVAVKAEPEAVKLYKPLTTDEDDVVRSKAAGQLARLVKPMPKVIEVAPTPAAAPPPKAASVDPPAAGSAAAPAGPDPALPQVEGAVKLAATALAETQTAREDVDKIVKDIGAKIRITGGGEAAVQRVQRLVKDLKEAADKLDAAAQRAATAHAHAVTAAGAAPSPEAAQRLAEAKASADAARTAAEGARRDVARAKQKAETFIDDESGTVPTALERAVRALPGDPVTARKELDRATRLLRAGGVRPSELDYQYGRTYDELAKRAADPKQKAELLQQALDSYRAYVKAGNANRETQRARDRAAAIERELAPAPAAPPPAP